MSYAIHKQVHPPTGVDHAVAAYFTRPIGDGGPPDLVVTQANRLTVYAVRYDDGGGQSGGGVGGDGGGPQPSLEVAAEFDLHGTVGSIAVLRRRFGAPRNQRDALLLAIRENKLSVVEFDPGSLGILTSSLHSWEVPGGTGAVPSALRVAPHPPLVIADPEGRCAAVLLRGEGHSRIVVLPAVEGGLEADTGDERARGPAASLLASYPIDLASVGVVTIRDVCFLHGYGEPVMLILHETSPTWAARLGLRRDTMALCALSLNVDKKKTTAVWTRVKLPHSAYRLVPCLPPLGGALVLSQNFLLHESQEVRPRERRQLCCVVLCCVV